jgi:sugar phosphate isomerase/epimerase
MQVSLGINTGFAINRFPEPDDWVGIVAGDLGLDTVQFTADLLNPFLPADIVAREVEAIAGLCARKGVRVQTTFTSQFTRVNHLMHPNPEVQRVWVDWFRRFFQVSRDLGAEGAGSHFGIMSVRDNADAATREKRINQAVDAWRELSEFGAEIGLKYLLFEPMSIPREVAETIPATQDILQRCAEGFAIPMRACLDVDHGDLQSTDPRDTDPHAWIRAFGKVSPCIHIKQSLRDKGGHYPFTAKYNEQGKIVPEEILATMREAGIERCTLLLEISHRERWPADYTVIDDLKESVAYWRPAVEAANRIS